MLSSVDDAYVVAPDDWASPKRGSSKSDGHKGRGKNSKTVTSPTHYAIVDKLRNGGFKRGFPLFQSWLRGTDSPLGPPGGLDIGTLIKSTQEAFEVIVPWCRIQAE